MTRYGRQVSDKGRANEEVGNMSFHMASIDVDTTDAGYEG
jgi:hypothetical protein